MGMNLQPHATPGGHVIYACDFISAQCSMAEACLCRNGLRMDAWVGVWVYKLGIGHLGQSKDTPSEVSGSQHACQMADFPEATPKGKFTHHQCAGRRRGEGCP
jgi:hypothetical protein